MEYKIALYFLLFLSTWNKYWDFICFLDGTFPSHLTHFLLKIQDVVVIKFFFTRDKPSVPRTLKFQWW